VAQSDQRAPTEVGDQEADLAGTDRLRQRAGAASTAASNAFKFNGDRRRSSISP
jgi:hypothetical protein